MTVPPFPAGRRPTPYRVADWVELSALSRRTAFKRGDLKSALAIEDVKDPDALEEAVWSVLGNRASIFGEQWPLTLRGNLLTARTNRSSRAKTIYKYFCLLGLGNIEDQDRRLFELLVYEVLKVNFEGNALHVGAPASAGMDPSFRVRVAQYATVSKLGRLEVGHEPLPDDKDLGLDVVAWIPNKDGRGGDLHFLVQCATGADWSEKLNDLNLRKWTPHINWAVPVRVFCVPMTLPATGDEWIRASLEAGLVLDRPRLHGLKGWEKVSASVHDGVASRVVQLSVA